MGRKAQIRGLRFLTVSSQCMPSSTVVTVSSRVTIGQGQDQRRPEARSRSVAHDRRAYGHPREVHRVQGIWGSHYEYAQTHVLST